MYFDQFTDGPIAVKLGSDRDSPQDGQKQHKDGRYNLGDTAPCQTWTWAGNILHGVLNFGLHGFLPAS
jgi:hypothetical protein